ncbi:MAG: hypothetical protein H6765_09380 [Candidatus Peribacteria bacterium]|nr:MAG: hypothetical protein H6765_09380 [Candidatus Peribacteria bacterium]
MAYPTDDDCDIVEKNIVIKYQPDICVDPITTLTIDSHVNNEIVTNSPIQLTGTVNGGVDHIEVVVNGVTYNATINGNVWSALVPLQPVVNNIWVIAYPTDDDCDIVEKGIIIKYHQDICVDPITSLSISSHTDNEVVTSSPVTLYGSVLGGVDHVAVVVNGTSYPATINGTVWVAANIPVQLGNNTFKVTAYPSDADCSPVTKEITLVYKVDVCVDPITNLTITTPTNGATTTGSSIVVTGTVSATAAQVKVNGVTASLVNGVYEATVSLAPGVNVITVIAYPTDDDCDTVQKTVSVTRETEEVCEDIVNLVITEPTDGTSTRKNSIVVEGTVSGGVTVVYVDGDAVNVDNNGHFETTVSLSYGTNVIAVKAGEGQHLQ